MDDPPSSYRTDEADVESDGDGGSDEDGRVNGWLDRLVDLLITHFLRLARRGVPGNPTGTNRSSTGNGGVR